MSRLEKLPQGIRGEIFRYLLSADRVRQSPNRFLIEDYAFEVGVLRLNRGINSEATAILYEENKFIKVHSFYGSVTEQSLPNHETPLFKVKTETFHNHMAEITFKPNAKRVALAGSKLSFLLLLQDIPKFARVSRILDFANFMGYEFHFALRQPPNMSGTLAVADQEKLLLPFQQVRGTAFQQQVTISDTFDTALAARVKQAMTQNVARLRAGAAEVYDLALSIKRIGDLAHSIGNADITLAKWDDTHNFIETTIKQNNMMKTRLEPEFLCYIYALDIMVWIDQAMFFLTDMAYIECGERKYKFLRNYIKHVEQVPDLNDIAKKELVPKTAVAQFYHCLGVAELGMDCNVKAAKAFVKAYKMVSSPETKRAYEFAKEWKRLTPTQRTAHLDSILTDCPKEPLHIPEFQAWSGPQVASEHWVMRELGFQGPIPYADKIKSKLMVALVNKPHPNLPGSRVRTAQLGHVKPEVLRKHVQSYQKQLAMPVCQGRGLAWIALGADQIGEESVFDSPNHVPGHGSLPESGGCPTQ